MPGNSCDHATVVDNGPRIFAAGAQCNTQGELRNRTGAKLCALEREAPNLRALAERAGFTASAPSGIEEDGDSLEFDGSAMMLGTRRIGLARST